MKGFFTALLAKLWCDHQYRYVDTVRDQDLRSGYEFWSERYICIKCGKIETSELRDQPR